MEFNMNNNCQLIVFSDKAYNAIIRETFEWDPVETGGILLGHILDNGCWIVMEVLPPGYGEAREGDKVFHEYGYFEYNRTFVNYLAKSVAEQYEIPLELLGLWHRHPGHMDHFSGTDDGTNCTFASQNPQGVISGLVNVDPQLRLTMYYLAHNDAISGRRPNYQTVELEVGSELIPEEYFRLRYYRGNERDLHSYAPQRTKDFLQMPHPRTSETNASGTCIDGNTIVREQMARNSKGRTVQVLGETENAEHSLSVAQDLIGKIKKNKTVAIVIVILLVIVALTVSAWKTSKNSQSFKLSGEDKSKLEIFTNEKHSHISDSTQKSKPEDSKDKK